MKLRRLPPSVALVLFLLFRCVWSCPPANIPSFEDTSKTELPGPVQALVLDYTFSCYGNVTMWGACVQPGGNPNNERYDIWFEVYRPTPQGAEGCYDFVGQNYLEGGIPLDRCVVLEDIPPEEQISVEPGDVVGFYSVHSRLNEMPANGGIQLVQGGGMDVTVWYNSGSMIASGPMSCRLRVDDEASLNSQTNHPPVITAHVLAITPPAPTPTPTQSPSPSPTPNHSSPSSSSLPSSPLQPQATPTSSSALYSSSSPFQSQILLQPTATSSLSSSRSSPVLSASNPTSPDSPESSSENPAIIIGVVVAVLVLIVLILILAILIVLYLKVRGKPAQAKDTVISSRRNGNRESGMVLLKGSEALSNPNYAVNSVDPSNNVGSPVPVGNTSLTAAPDQPPAHDYQYVSQGSSSHEYSYTTVPQPNDDRNKPYAYVNPGDVAGGASGNTHLYHTVEQGGSGEAQYADPRTLPHNRENGYHTLEPWEGHYDDPDNRPLHYDDPNPPAFQSLIYSDDAFESAGLYVPTQEQRLAGGDHYEMLQSNQYNRLNFFVDDQTYWAPATTTSKLYEQLALKRYREIPRPQIRLQEQLGSGQFGEVCKGTWLYSEAVMEVAVKMLKPGAKESEKVKFLREAAIMGQFSSHPSVVTLYGVVTVGEPAMIVLEIMAHGDLKTFLGKLDLDKYPNQIDLQYMFLRFAREIASGMAYLARKSFVHRDLAARNILLDQQLTCKIGDFGMARDLMDDTYYTSSGGKIPVKWTAPEALLYKKFSADSDKWSYGMVLFEVWSVGCKPFLHLTNNDVVSLVQTGYCQPPPPGCPRGVYALMVDCWNPDHKQRPSFDKIVTYLKQPEDTLLYWSETDLAAAGTRSNVLGAPSTESRKLYVDLQKTYKIESSA